MSSLIVWEATQTRLIFKTMITIIGHLNVKEEMFQVLEISIQVRTVYLLKYLLGRLVTDALHIGP